MGKLFHSSPDLDDVMTDETPEDLKALGWDRYTFITVHRGDMRAIADALAEAKRLLERDGRYSWLDAPVSLAREYANDGLPK